LEQGTIVFHPETGRPARGTIERGKIVEVTTFEPGDGAPVGPVKIAIQSIQPDPQDETGMKVISLIPARYADSASSGLEATIKRGETNPLRLELTD
jgi:hypothetical protein